MANKRCFSLSVTDTDNFLDLPTSAQCLYFHLGMHGDDDGFVSSPRKIMKSVGCSESDLDELIKAGLIYRFESGVIVVADWKINNSLQNDRYHPTVYQEEFSQLEIQLNKRYSVRVSILDTDCIQHGNST